MDSDGKDGTGTAANAVPRRSEDSVAPKTHTEQVRDVLAIAHVRADDTGCTMTEVLLAEILVRLRNEAMEILPDGSKK